MSWRVPTEAKSDRVFPGPIRGTVENHRFSSRVLKGNPWGDPEERDLPVYLPPSGGSDGLPLILLLTGLHRGRLAPFPAPEVSLRHDHGATRPIDSTQARPRGRHGGAGLPHHARGKSIPQLLGHGALRGLCPRGGPTLRARTLPHGAHRRDGHVERRYGSLVLALRHPDILRAAGSNAGDAYFEYCYAPEFPIAFREIRKAGGPEKLLEKVLHAP